MKAILLAAGHSTRTQPLTVNKPKPLLTAGNRSIIEHNLLQMKGIIDEVIIIIGFCGDQIKKRLGTLFSGIKISYIEEKELLGTGYAALLAEEKAGEHFLVMNSDDFYFSADIKKCIKHKFCILAKKVSNPSLFGILRIDNGKVAEIIEKPAKPVGDMANTGCYVMSKEIFDLLKKTKKSKRGEIEITDALNVIAAKGDLAFEEANNWFPISYPWSLLDANEFFINNIKNDIKGTVEKNVTVNGLLTVGKGTVIKSGTYIEGPVIIGEDSVIGPNAYLRPGSCIGNNCKVGASVEIKNSIIMDGAKVPHLSYIGDSVIGENSNLGAGTITANLRHDGGEVKSMVKGELISTGRKKLGAIIADNVHTGIHTSIYPGRKIWPGKSTLPGEIVIKDIT